MRAWVSRTSCRSGSASPTKSRPLTSARPRWPRLEAGETFYTQNFGIAELRSALAAYVSRLHRPIAVDNVAVTASGMSALMLSIEALVDPGDRVVCVTPLWPNLTEIPKILGAEVVRVALQFGRGGWTLDIDRLLEALTPGTRALMINSPNNPTGWTMARDDQRAILEHCRRHGIWIVADDVYERLYYAGEGCAPSFLDLADASDRLVSTNSFSKAWLMTGWRLGWIVAPQALMSDLGKLIEYNTSCSPVFVQRAGVAALRDGEPTVAHTLERFRAARALLVTRLASIDGVEAAPPPGCDVRVLSRSRRDATAWRSASDWCARRDSGSRPAVHSAPKARASCAGASPQARERLQTACAACAVSSPAAKHRSPVRACASLSYPDGVQELAQKTVEMVRSALACRRVATSAIEGRAHAALHGFDDCLVFQFNLMQCAAGALAVVSPRSIRRSGTRCACGRSPAERRG